MQSLSSLAAAETRQLKFFQTYFLNNFFTNIFPNKKR